MSIVTTTTLPPQVQQSFSYKLLAVAVPNMIHNTCAMQKNMPAHSGTKLRMSRYNPLQTSLVPLGNTGVTPPGQQLTRLDLDAELSFYGFAF